MQAMPRMAGRKPMETMKLQDWQVPLAERQTDVLRRERCFLSSACTGAGKTYLSAQTIKDLGLKTLVVAPKISLTQWRRVLEGMGAMPFVEAVVNPEALITSRKQKLYDADLGWSTDSKFLVWDEIHRSCSGEKSKSTKALARWCNRAHPDNKVLAMSATPFESPLKLRALGYLMGFHQFRDADWYRFLRANGCSLTSRGGRSHLEFTKDRLRSAAIMRKLREAMGDRFMSITPDRIPGFPEESREVVLVDLAKEDHDALVRAYEEMPERIREPSRDEMVKVLRLRQQAEFCKAGALAEMAADHVEDGNSVFICVNFVDARLRIQEALGKAGVQFASIYGGQPERERQAGIAAFQNNDVHVMVGMAAACSVALSLHDERHERPRVSLISPGYSAAEFSQALGRIRRVGGTFATQKVVMAAGSVEEKVGRTIERKMNNLAVLTDDDLVR